VSAVRSHRQNKKSTKIEQIFNRESSFNKKNTALAIHNENILERVFAFWPLKKKRSKCYRNIFIILGSLESAQGVFH